MHARPSQASLVEPQARLSQQAVGAKLKAKQMAQPLVTQEQMTAGL